MSGIFTELFTFAVGEAPSPECEIVLFICGIVLLYILIVEALGLFKSLASAGRR